MLSVPAERFPIEGNCAERRGATRLHRDEGMREEEWGGRGGTGSGERALLLSLILQLEGPEKWSLGLYDLSLSML